jgi:hypothetical protein
MSHLTCSKIAITDLDLLKKTIAGFGGLEFKENKDQFKWYYGKEEAEERFGKCEHAISIKGAGCGYEIGLVKNKEGPGWKMAFDPYDGVAARIVGANCEKVMSAYAETYIRDHAERNGFIMEQTTDEEGNLCLTMTPGT